MSTVFLELHSLLNFLLVSLSNSLFFNTSHNHLHIFLHLLSLLATSSFLLLALLFSIFLYILLPVHHIISILNTSYFGIYTFSSFNTKSFSIFYLSFLNTFTPAFFIFSTTLTISSSLFPAIFIFFSISTLDLLKLQIYCSLIKDFHNSFFYTYFPV